MSAVDDQPPRAPVPARPTLGGLREAAQTCRACELWADATQAVFGSGARHARLMLVGEQPGDREDLEGEPFVEPASGVLDRGLQRAGIDREQVYVTNVVKHFRYRRQASAASTKSPDSSPSRRTPLRSCARSENERRQAMDAFVSDLEQVSQWLDQR